MLPVTLSVDDIANNQDPVVRNLQITQRYHELAVGLRDAGGADDATWCGFAVWASKTAGATIRGDVLPARAKELLLNDKATKDIIDGFKHGIGEWVAEKVAHDHLAEIIDDVTKDVSKSIAAGNVLVFRELAPIFASLLDARQASSATPQSVTAALAPALAQLGSDPQAAAVAEAFAAYGQALFGPDDRAALVLRANTLAVAHEQQRLQDAIAKALDAAVSDTLQKVVDDAVVRHLPSAEARKKLDDLLNDLFRAIDAAWDTALTESIMQLVTATETFDLRRDVPPLPDGMFPPVLRDLGGTPAADAVAQWDKTGGTGDAVGRARLGGAGGADELHRQSLPLPPARSRPLHPAVQRRNSSPSWLPGSCPPDPL